MLCTITKPALLAGLLFFAVFFSACADRVKTDIIVYKALDESLVNSNKTINRSTETLLFYLENKLTEPYSHIKAEIWRAKAMRINEMTSPIMKYIDDLKNDLKKEAGLHIDKGVELFREADKNAVIRLFDKKEKGKELYERLRKYKTDIMAVDSQMAETFKNETLLTTREFDANENKDLDFSKTFFDDIPTVAALAMLSQIQNNVKNIENRMANFCNNKVPENTGGI